MRKIRSYLVAPAIAVSLFMAVCLMCAYDVRRDVPTLPSFLYLLPESAYWNPLLYLLGGAVAIACAALVLPDPDSPDPAFSLRMRLFVLLGGLALSYAACWYYGNMGVFNAALCIFGGGDFYYPAFVAVMWVAIWITVKRLLGTREKKVD